MAKKWIAGMHMKQGAMTAQAKRAGMTPMAFAREHMGEGGVTGRRARLAITLRKLGKRKGTGGGSIATGRRG